MENIRIKCPDAHLNKAERIDLIIEEFNKWISDDMFVELVNVFGGKYDLDLPPVERIIWLKEEFIDIWDYRKKQREAQTKEGEAARWLLRDDPMGEIHRELIYKASERLGLIGINQSLFDDPDYLLPLGGARMSNLERCKLAKKEMFRVKGPVTVAALSGMRPIADSERVGYIDTYARNAVTEFDAIVEGMKIVFSPLVESNVLLVEDDNPNLTYCIRQFECSDYDQNRFFCIAAPSSVPSRRANSADTFRFFFRNLNVPKYSRLVSCTSQIYCSYQQVQALSFAVDYEVEFDTIGFWNDPNPEESQETKKHIAVNYLQEIKATIDAMYAFIEKYVYL